MNDFNTLLSTIQEQFLQELDLANDSETLEKIRIAYLGRHGALSELMAQLKSMSLEQKKIYGPALNSFKQEAQAQFDNKLQRIEAQKNAQEAEKSAHFDVTAYTPHILKGSLHPSTYITQRIEDIFISMGFEIADGPEVEYEEYNFDALNIPADHPARDMQDTFWLTIPHMLMRTQTSSVQIRKMKDKKPPLAIVSPGRCYRNEATDASHDIMFTQVELLMVDKHISLSNLFALIKVFLQELFEKKDLPIRIRPSYFPFVEPGIEVDMSCPFCTAGCSVCKKTQWIELGGAGLVHPKVLEACSINPEQYSGCAFGFGLTRLVLLKYGINDIRLLHGNRLDFLKQF